MPLSRREREKTAREAEIIAAAEKLFYEKGFENTSMDEIARASEFTKRTLYQYFINKEDLFFAVTLKGVKQLLSYIQKAASRGKTGFQKIRFIKEAAYNCSRDFPDIFRMMNYIQYIRSDADSSPNQQEILDLNNQVFYEFKNAINEGREDGSIRRDFDTTLETFAFFFVITGSISRLSEVGDIYSMRFGVNTDTLAKLTFDLTDRLILPDHH